MALIKPNTSKNTISATLSSIAFAPFSLTFYIIRKTAELIYFLATSFVHVVIAPFVWAHSFFKKRTPFSTRGLPQKTAGLPYTTISDADKATAIQSVRALELVEPADPDADNKAPRSPTNLTHASVPEPDKKIVGRTSKQESTEPKAANTQGDRPAPVTKQTRVTEPDAGQKSTQLETANAQSAGKNDQLTRATISRNPGHKGKRPKSKATPDPRYIVLKLMGWIPALSVEADPSRQAVDEEHKTTQQGFIIRAGTAAHAKNSNHGSTLIPFDENNEKDKAFSEFLTTACLLLSVIEFPVILAQASLGERKDISEEGKQQALSNYEVELSGAIGKLFRHLLTGSKRTVIQEDKQKIIAQFNRLTEEGTNRGFGIVADGSTSPILTAQGNFLTRLAGVTPDTNAETLGHLTAALDSLIVKTPSLEKNVKALQVFDEDLRNNALTFDKKPTFFGVVNGENGEKLIFREYFMKAGKHSNDSTVNSAKLFSRFLSELSEKSHNLAFSILTPSDWNPLLEYYFRPTVTLATMAEGDDEQASEASSTNGASDYRNTGHEDTGHEDDDTASVTIPPGNGQATALTNNTFAGLISNFFVGSEDPKKSISSKNHSM